MTGVLGSRFVRAFECYIINQLYWCCFGGIAVRAQRKERLQSDLEAAIATIVRTVNEKKDHIPPVVSSAAVTFPFDISIAG